MYTQQQNQCGFIFEWCGQIDASSYVYYVLFATVAECGVPQRCKSCVRGSSSSNNNNKHSLKWLNQLYKT